MNRSFDLRFRNYLRVAVIVAASSLWTACATTQEEEARNYIADARAALEDGRLTEARTLAELASERTPHDRKSKIVRAEVTRQLARRALEDQDLETAYERYLDAAKLEPRRYHVAYDLINAVRTGSRIGKAPTELAPHAERAVKADPTSLEARRRAAQLWDDAGEPARALDHYLWLWEADRSDLQIGARLAACYRATDQLDDAVAIYRRILKRDPENVQAALNLASVSADLGHDERAKSLYEKLLKRFPENPSILLRFASFLERRGHSDRATALRQRAQEAMPGVDRRQMRRLR